MDVIKERNIIYYSYRIPIYVQTQLVDYLCMNIRGYCTSTLQNHYSSVYFELNQILSNIIDDGNH